MAESGIGGQDPLWVAAQPKYVSKTIGKLTDAEYAAINQMM